LKSTSTKKAVLFELNPPAKLGDSPGVYLEIDIYCEGSTLGIQSLSLAKPGH
jgi:hypothetical protein